MVAVALAAAMGVSMVGAAHAAPPTDIALDPASVDEDAPVGTVVGEFTTTDPDAGDTHTYTLEPGLLDNDSFQVVGAELQTAAALDFETKPSYSIRVRATDAPDGETFDEDFTITVGDVDENPPGPAPAPANASGNPQPGAMQSVTTQTGSPQVLVLGFLDVAAARSGKGFARLAVTVPLPGAVIVRDGAGGSAARAAQRRRRRRALIRTTAVVARRAGTVMVTIRPSRAGKKVLARAGYLRVRALVTFAPAQGRPTTFTRTILIKQRIRRKRR